MTDAVPLPLHQPEVETARLTLRPFGMADAGDVQRLAGAREVASTTLNIPHPYEDGMAQAWIESHEVSRERGESLTWAIVGRSEHALLGAVGLRLVPQSHRGELGYWIGLPYWGQGYCTEAAQAVLGIAFGTLMLNRVHASHLTRNPASGRVMQKLGMRHEGRLRQHVRKWDVFEDLDVYGILREDFPAG